MQNYELNISFRFIVIMGSIIELVTCGMSIDWNWPKFLFIYCGVHGQLHFHNIFSQINESQIMDEPNWKLWNYEGREAPNNNNFFSTSYKFSKFSNWAFHIYLKCSLVGTSKVYTLRKNFSHILYLPWKWVW
jgi:hypothetical protein